jgi:hypothetical protein
MYVVGLDPRPHPLAHVPGRVVPYQQQGLLPLRPQLLAHPRQVILGHLTDRTTCHETQHHLPGVRTQQPVARQRLGIRVILGNRLLHQMPRLILGRPSVHCREGQTTPPRFVLVAQHPLRVRRGHLIAVFVKKQQYAVAARFIEADYHCLDGLGLDRYNQCGADGFNEYMETLDETDYHGRDRAEKPTGELIMTRATHPKVSFADLFQVDFLLWLRPYFPEPGGCQHWYPRCIGYARDRGTLEVFAKATSKTGFDAVRHILKVKTLRELFDRLMQLQQDQQFVQTLQRRHFLQMRLGELINLNGMMHALGIRQA